MPQARGTRIRATRQAAAIVAVMSRMRAFCGARDIYDALLGEGQPVGLATVYRHLHVLTEQGDVDTLYTASGESRYRLRDSGATCHLTCRACGRIVVVDGSEIREWAGRVAAGAGFTLTRYSVALSGLCSAHGEGQPGGPTPPASTGMLRPPASASPAPSPPGTARTAGQDRATRETAGRHPETPS